MDQVPAQVRGDPLGSSRVTLLKNVLPLAPSETEAVRKLYLASYANSKHCVDYEDFSFYAWKLWTFTSWAASE